MKGRSTDAFLLGAVLFCWLCPTVDARAGQENSTQEVKFVEPILTEETLPNDRQELSLRVSAAHLQHDVAAIGALPRIDLFYGVAERVGAELSVPLAYHRAGGRTIYGMGDVSLGLKYLVVEPSSAWPAVVFGLEAGFATGRRSRGLGEGAYEVEPFVALLRDFGACTLQGNFGWSKQVNQEREARFTYNWALAVPVSERKMYVLVEINGDWGREAQTAVAPGFKYYLTERMFVGVAAPFGLTDSAPDWGLVAQFQVGF